MKRPLTELRNGLYLLAAQIAPVDDMYTVQHMDQLLALRVPKHERGALLVRTCEAHRLAAQPLIDALAAVALDPIAFRAACTDLYATERALFREFREPCGRAADAAITAIGAEVRRGMLGLGRTDPLPPLPRVEPPDSPGGRAYDGDWFQ